MHLIMSNNPPQKNPSIIFVVIPSHNRRHLLKNILNCLNKQILQSVQLSIVVVVDGSTDGTLEMLANQYPDVSIVMGDGEWWYTKSINEGIKFSLTFEPDYILTLNDDSTIDIDYVQTIHNHALSQAYPSLIGSLCLSDSAPQIVFFAGVKNICWPLYKWNYYHSLGKSSDCIVKHGLYSTAVLPGRGMLIPANVFAKIGFFDEDFPQYGSDEDFSLRAAAAGIRSLISYNAIIYSNIQSTDKSSVFSNNLKISTFLISLFRTHSSNYLGKEIRFVLRHGCWWSLPIVVPKIIVSRIFNFIKGWMWEAH